MKHTVWGKGYPSATIYGRAARMLISQYAKSILGINRVKCGCLTVRFTRDTRLAWNCSQIPQLHTAHCTWILNQLNPVHVIKTYFRTIQFNTILSSPSPASKQLHYKRLTSQNPYVGLLRNNQNYCRTIHTSLTPYARNSAFICILINTNTHTHTNLMPVLNWKEFRLHITLHSVTLKSNWLFRKYKFHAELSCILRGG
jgi:hypothetical protein